MRPWFVELNPEFAEVEVTQRLDALDHAAYWAVATDPERTVIGVAGLGSFCSDPDVTAGFERAAEVFCVYVAKPWLGLGVGRVLVADVEARARTLGFTDVIAVSGARHREIGYPFWNRRYGEAIRIDENYWGDSERIVWHLSLHEPAAR